MLTVSAIKGFIFSIWSQHDRAWKKVEPENHTINDLTRQLGSKEGRVMLCTVKLVFAEVVLRAF